MVWHPLKKKKKNKKGKGKKKHSRVGFIICLFNEVEHYTSSVSHDI